MNATSRSSANRKLVAAFWSLAAVVAVIHFGAAASLAYLAAALAVGFVLWQRGPEAYVSFVLQLFFFTPLFRRLVDHQAGWNPKNPIVVAPFAVAAIAAATLWAERDRLFRRPVLPFFVPVVAVVYGYAIGLLNGHALSASWALLEWGVPPLFACHLLLRRFEPGALSRTLLTTFTFGTILVGLYGIAQFFQPLPWDAEWAVNSTMISSLGRPDPFKMRVFSTINSTGPCALLMMTSLLYLFALRGWPRWLAVAAGVPCLLLTLVRSAWGGFAVGMAILAFLSPLRLRLQIVGVMAGLLILGLLASFVEPIAGTVRNRMDSLNAIESDGSFMARADTYERYTAESFSDPIGAGLGSAGAGARLENSAGEDTGGFDSAWLCLPMVLGWPGLLLYGGGLCVAACWSLAPSPVPSLVSTAGRAAAVALLTQTFFGNTFTGLSAVLTWLTLGFVAAVNQEGAGGKRGRPAPRHLVSRSFVASPASTTEGH